MRIAILGLGGIAQKAYLPLLTGRADLEILLSARTEASVRQTQARYRIEQGTTDLDEVLNRRPEAAFVLTPNDTHYEIARRLLEGGVDVYLEKPAALSATEAEDLAALAGRLGRVLVVGFNRRYAPLHLRTRQILGDRPVTMAIFQKYRASPGYPNLARQYLDDTIHQIDLLRFFCGEAQPVLTLQQSREGRVASSTTAVALDGGGIAQVITCHQAGRWQERYEIHAEGLSILIDAFSRARVITPENEALFEEEYSYWTPTLEGRGFVGQVNHFLECVRRGADPLNTAREAAKSQRLMEAMLEK
ncbi:MAG: Gfo/Idh/MocA family oxidoreductase [Chloroflexi bacterium]|nr:Gfo/Idh/MocA family oxidoreductase [Chloroflexota bacterium]